jgi:hypothetical protein
MKSYPVIAFCMLMLLPGCEFLTGDSFPDCVGIEEEFDPNTIENAYDGQLWNQDTSFNTQFIFTEYTYDIRVMSDRWVMYFKRTISPTKTMYQSADCYQSDLNNDFWFAKTYFEFDGQYSMWEFYFEVFDCSELSGYCTVIRPDIPDTLDFNFEGSR